MGRRARQLVAAPEPRVRVATRLTMTWHRECPRALKSNSIRRGGATAKIKIPLPASTRRGRSRSMAVANHWFVRAHWDHASTEPPRRAGVRSRSQGASLGKAETGEGTDERSKRIP